MPTITHQSSELELDPIRFSLLEHIRTFYQKPQPEVPQLKAAATEPFPNRIGNPTSDRFEISNDEIGGIKESIEKTDKLLMDTINNFEKTGEQLTTFSFLSSDEGTVSSESYPERPFGRRHMLLKSVTVEYIIGTIRRHGFDAIAKRLTALHETILEEREEKPIVVDSLQNFARFLSKYPLPNPAIGITPDGFLQAVWRIQGHGTLVMNFLPSADIMFAAIFAQHDLASPRRKISGVMPPRKMMRCVEDFVDKLTVQ